MGRVMMRIRDEVMRVESNGEVVMLSFGLGKMIEAVPRVVAKLDVSRAYDVAAVNGWSTHQSLGVSSMSGACQVEQEGCLWSDVDRE